MEKMVRNSYLTGRVQNTRSRWSSVEDVNDWWEIGVVGSVGHDDIMPSLEIWVARHEVREGLYFVLASDKAWSVRTEIGETWVLACKSIIGPIDSRIVNINKSGCCELSGIGL